MKHFFRSSILMLFIASIYSCTNNSPISQEKSNIIQSEKIIKLKFIDNNLVKKILTKSYKNLEFSSLILNNEEFSKLKILNNSYINKKCAYVYIFDNLVSKSTELNLNNVKGICVYSYDKSISFEFYKFVNNNFELVPELSSEVSGIVAPDLSLITNRILNLRNVSKTIMVVGNENIDYKSSKPIKYNYDLLSIKVGLLSKKMNIGRSISKSNSISNIPGGGGSNLPNTCGGPCDYFISNAHCSLNPVGPYECYSNVDAPCLIAPMNSNVLGLSMIGSDTVNTAFSSGLLYNLRDSIFNYTFWGLKMTKYYYTLQNYFSVSSLSTNIKINTTYTLFDFRNSIYKLNNFESYPNDTVISFSMRNRILNLINDYKNVNNDSTYLAMLNDLQSDVIHMNTKTISEFITEIVNDTDYQ